MYIAINMYIVKIKMITNLDIRLIKMIKMIKIGEL